MQVTKQNFKSLQYGVTLHMIHFNGSKETSVVEMPTYTVLCHKNKMAVAYGMFSHKGQSFEGSVILNQSVLNELLNN